MPYHLDCQPWHRNLEITPLQSSRAVSGRTSCRGPGPTLLPDRYLLSTVTTWMIAKALAPLKWNVEQWIRSRTHIYVPNRAWRPAGEGTRKFEHVQLGIETPDASPASEVQQRKPKTRRNCRHLGSRRKSNAKIVREHCGMIWNNYETMNSQPFFSSMGWWRGPKS